MPIPDFQRNGAPAPKPNLPYAEPNIPNARPTGLPPGMSPLPKTEPPPSNVPIPKPSAPGQPITKPLPKPDFGGKTAKPPREFPKTNTPRTPGPKPFVPTIPQLIRKVIEYVLEPQPTSDGTAPDYEETRPEDEPYPDTNTEPELEQQECLDVIKYPQLKGKPNDSLTQLTYYVTPGHRQTYFYSFPRPSSVVIARKTYLTSEMLDFSGPDSGFRIEYKMLGKQTYDKGQPNASAVYKVGVRDGSKRTGDGLFIWNGWTVLETGALLLSTYPSFPSPIASRADLLTKLLYQGANYISRFPVQAYPCPEEEPDYQDPNTYDREQDDNEMPCKWKPENDADVDQLEMAEYEYQGFSTCYLTDGTIPTPIFSTERIQLPVGSAPAFLQVLKLHNEALAAKCVEVPPIYYWGLKPGNQNTVFAGMPSITGQEISLPMGCCEVGITFDASQAKADKNLRDLKRISSTASNENSFINVARVWIIDNQGNAIASEQIWVPSTILHIPLQYRTKICKLRLLVKSIAVTFTVFDSGARWALLRGEVS